MEQTIFETPAYAEYHKQDIEIIIAYFSPCNFTKPRSNFYRIINKLIQSKYAIRVIEAIFPHSDPLCLPSEVIHNKFYVTGSSIMFLKENLYNVALQLTQKPKLVFMDADIEHSDPQWLINTSNLLDSYDIVQPFDVAYWLDKDNQTSVLEKQNCIKEPLLNNENYSGARYHPGFIWAFRRESLIQYTFCDFHPIGGSDTAFIMSLCKNEKQIENIISFWAKSNYNFIETKWYQNYKEKINKTNPKIMFLSGNNVKHLYHGSRDKRQYVTRVNDFLPDVFSNIESLLIYNKNGILEWKNQIYAKKCLEYFQSRYEDD